MNYLEYALSFDREERPREAAWAYELALRSADADLSTYLNLVAVYFSCNDPGFFAVHHLPDGFVAAAYERALLLLDEAQARFGWHPEIETWRHHLRERVAAVAVAEGVYEDLARHESAKLAKLLVHLSSGEQVHAAEVRALFAWASSHDTELQRYISSFSRDWNA